MANLRADFIGIVLSPDDAYRGNRMALIFVRPSLLRPTNKTPP
jgi:hypothetical protein